MVYIAYFTELILQICDYAQKRRIWRESCKYALDENFHCHFCFRRKAAKFCHPEWGVGIFTEITVRYFDERSRSRSEDNPFWFCSPVMQYDVWWSPVRRVLVCYQPSWAIGPILALVAGHKGKSQSHTSGGRAQVYRTTALTSTEIIRNTMSCSCLVLTWIYRVHEKQTMDLCLGSLWGWCNVCISGK